MSIVMGVYSLGSKRFNRTESLTSFSCCGVAEESRAQSADVLPFAPHYAESEGSLRLLGISTRPKVGGMVLLPG